MLELQEALHAKAKGKPSYRFYALYDKLYRYDVLREAWRRSRAKGGVPGADGKSYEQIEREGVRRWLEELAQELREKRYKLGALRRVWIPKANGKQRPLGIPSNKDRVVQMAAVLILEPIFEADLQPELHALLTGTRCAPSGAGSAWLAGARAQRSGGCRLERLFDASRSRATHPSGCLRQSVSPVPTGSARHHPAPGTGEKPGATNQRREHAGVAQELAILGWKQNGYEKRLKARIVNYADDFVILCANRDRRPTSPWKN